MMIPPVINYGYPPFPSQTGDRTEYIVLVNKRGWLIAKWDTLYSGMLIDTDAGVPQEWRYIPMSEVRCWMRQDGR